MPVYSSIHWLGALHFVKMCMVLQSCTIEINAVHTHTLTQALLHGSWSRVAFGESFFEFDLNKTHFNLSRCLTLCGVAF